MECSLLLWSSTSTRLGVCLGISMAKTNPLHVVGHHCRRLLARSGELVKASAFESAGHISPLRDHMRVSLLNEDVLSAISRVAFIGMILIRSQRFADQNVAVVV